MTDLPVAIIGAGPIGLAAAAHLATRNDRFVVLEAGASVGAHVLGWGHVQVFSPWRYDVDPVSRVLLEAAGWKHPDPDALPTGAEIVADYLRPLAALPRIAPTLRLDTLPATGVCSAAPVVGDTETAPVAGSPATAPVGGSPATACCAPAPVVPVAGLGRRPPSRE